MAIIFPHANGHSVSDEVFTACWQQLIGNTRHAPRLSRRKPLAEYLTDGMSQSLEHLCRVLVPAPYRNTAQATQRFMAVNRHLLQPTEIRNPLTGRMVAGVQLLSTPVAIGQRARRFAETVIEALEVEDGKGLAKSTSILTPSRRLQSWVASFVEDVHAEPFQAMYRLKPVADQVTGWPARLQTYFWPSPSRRIAANSTTVERLVLRLRPLALAIESGRAWTPSQSRSAIDIAKDVFEWGGVPQDPSTVTAKHIERVIRSAVSKVLVPDALMNSGWTKVAAFASDHLETNVESWPEVIWDSRVATSVVARLDRLIASDGKSSVPPELVGLGRVDAGRGGTRPRRYRLRWPSGYGSWPAQLSGSRFVALVRDYLNENLVKYGRMPPLAVGADSGKWTVRGVEMVLFMDGY